MLTVVTYYICINLVSEKICDILTNVKSCDDSGVCDKVGGLKLCRLKL